MPENKSGCLFSTQCIYFASTSQVILLERPLICTSQATVWEDDLQCIKWDVFSTLSLLEQ